MRTISQKLGGFLIDKIFNILTDFLKLYMLLLCKLITKLFNFKLFYNLIFLSFIFIECLYK